MRNVIAYIILAVLSVFCGLVCLLIGQIFIGVILLAAGVLCILQSRKERKKKKDQDTAAALAAAHMAAERNDIKETIKVAGTSFYKDEIEELGNENENYTLTKKGIIDEGFEDERIYQYDFYPVKVELVPDPENEQDKNAIKVIVDGYQIGHVPADKCAYVHGLLSSGRIQKVDIEIYGGNYKYYDSDEEKLEKHEQDFGASLTLSLIP